MRGTTTGVGGVSVCTGWIGGSRVVAGTVATTGGTIGSCVIGGGVAKARGKARARGDGVLSTCSISS